VSEEAMVQMNLFQAMLHNLLPGDGYDTWSILDSSKSLKVSHIYTDMMGNAASVPALKWMWDGYCQQKQKLFFLVAYPQ
jgi:hypothetical protein